MKRGGGSRGRRVARDEQAAPECSASRAAALALPCRAALSRSPPTPPLNPCPLPSSLTFPVQILKYHVVPGAPILSNKMQDDLKLPTLLAADLEVGRGYGGSGGGVCVCVWGGGGGGGGSWALLVVLAVLLPLLCRQLPSPPPPRAPSHTGVCPPHPFSPQAANAAMGRSYVKKGKAAMDEPEDGVLVLDVKNVSAALRCAALLLCCAGWPHHAPPPCVEVPCAAATLPCALPMCLSVSPCRRPRHPPVPPSPSPPALRRCSPPSASPPCRSALAARSPWWAHSPPPPCWSLMCRLVMGPPLLVLPSCCRCGAG